MITSCGQIKACQEEGCIQDLADMMLTVYMSMLSTLMAISGELNYPSVQRRLRGNITAAMRPSYEHTDA